MAADGSVKFKVAPVQVPLPPKFDPYPDALSVLLVVAALSEATVEQGEIREEACPLLPLTMVSRPDPEVRTPHRSYAPKYKFTPPTSLGIRRSR